MRSRNVLTAQQVIARLIQAGAIESTNYDPDGTPPYSAKGTRFDLDNGDLQTPGLFVNGATRDVSIRGDVTASAFRLLDGSTVVAELDADLVAAGSVPSHGLVLNNAVANYTDGYLSWSDDTITTAPQVQIAGPQRTASALPPPRLQMSSSSTTASAAMLVNGLSSHTPSVTVSAANAGGSAHGSVTLQVSGVGGLANIILSRSAGVPALQLKAENGEMSFDSDEIGFCGATPVPPRNVPDISTAAGDTTARQKINDIIHALEDLGLFV